MKSFTDWLKDKSLQEMAKGYYTGEDDIKNIMWMAIGQKMNSNAIADHLGGSITPRSVNRILARYGLTRNTLAAIRTEAESQASVSSHGRTQFANNASPLGQDRNWVPPPDPSALMNYPYPKG